MIPKVRINVSKDGAFDFKSDGEPGFFGCLLNDPESTLFCGKRGGLLVENFEKGLIVAGLAIVGALAAGSYLSLPEFSKEVEIDVANSTSAIETAEGTDASPFQLKWPLNSKTLTSFEKREIAKAIGRTAVVSSMVLKSYDDDEWLKGGKLIVSDDNGSTESVIGRRIKIFCMLSNEDGEAFLNTIQSGLRLVSAEGVIESFSEDQGVVINPCTYKDLK